MSELKRISLGIGGLAATLALALPSVASAGLVDDVLGGVKDTVDETVGGLLGGNGGGGGPSGGGPAPLPGPAPAPAPLDATTEPEIDGTNPHAEGAVIDTTIENPLGDPIGVTVGQARGDQDANGDYHGLVNILAVDNLPLIGDQEIGIDTDEGESESSPIGAINDLLDQVCTAGDVCLGLLDYSSETTGKGSENNFSAASADVLSGTVALGLVNSDGNISETKKCQNANSSSSAANVGVASDLISADAIESESESEACRGKTPTASGDSQTINLGALQALDPLNLIGCDQTAVDDEFEIPVVVGGVCNGDDTNGSQADAPYNKRVALQVDALDDVLNLLGVDIDLDGSPSESLAQAPDATDPPDPECPDPNNPDCDDDPDDPNDPDDPDGPDGPGGPGGPSADSPGSLPFTGADMGVLGLIGGLVMGSGLGLMAVADRRRRSGGSGSA